MLTAYGGMSATYGYQAKLALATDFLSGVTSIELTTQQVD